MLSWAIGFFILALVAAFFGFGGIASSAAGIAKVLLVLFVIAFVVSLLLGMRSRGGRIGGIASPRSVLAKQRVDLASAEADVLQRAVAEGVQLSPRARRRPGGAPSFQE